MAFSCGPSAKFMAPDYSRPQKVALLPTINQTNDVKGGIVFRNLLYKKLKKKKYANLQEISWTDATLNQAGITDGGQLPTLDPTELLEMLGVDGIIYIELVKCENTPLNLFESGKVKANFKLYIPPAKLIWEDEREQKAKSHSAKLGQGLSKFFKSYGEKVSEDLKEQAAEAWLKDHELKDEMEKLIKKSLKTLK
jgi:hypothetical protein